MTQQDQATELNRAKTIQGIQDANDMVDVGGIKIPRAQAPQMISALANKRFQEGKLSNEDYMLETEKAYKTALTNAYLEGQKGDVAKAAKYNQEASLLKEKLGIIQGMVKTGKVTEVDRAALGLSSATAKTNQMPSLIKSSIETMVFPQGMQDRMKYPEARHRFTAAMGIAGKMWEAGRRDATIANDAVKYIQDAEQGAINEYLKAQGNPKLQRELIDSYRLTFGYIPKVISDAEESEGE